MPSSLKPRSVRVAGRRALVTTTVLELLAALLALSGPASANPAGSNLVISEVYGAGANPGAVYNADYVELFNPTGSDIGLSGLSVQSRFGGVTTPLPLTGTVAAGEHFLIQMTAAGAVGADLPSPDQVATSDVEMGGAAGQVFLVIGTTAFLTTGNVAGDAQLVDMVGYGVAAGTFESAPTGVALSASLAARVTRSAPTPTTTPTTSPRSHPTRSTPPAAGAGDPQPARHQRLPRPHRCQHREVGRDDREAPRRPPAPTPTLLSGRRHDRRLAVRLGHRTGPADHRRAERPGPATPPRWATTSSTTAGRPARTASSPAGPQRHSATTSAPTSTPRAPPTRSCRSTRPVDMNGVKVGVIGAVTAGDRSLVSPGGHRRPSTSATPSTAVNRVAASSATADAANARPT